MMYDVPTSFTPKFEKVDSVSFSVKGHEMIDPERVGGLQYDRVLWGFAAHVLAESAGNEMNAINDDLYYEWIEDDDDEEEDLEEARGLDVHASWRRLLDGSRTQVSTLWVYAWLALEGFSNFAVANHPRMVAGAEAYEARAVALEDVVESRDTDALEPLLYRVRDTAVHTHFGAYGKALHQLSTLWYLATHVYRTELSNMEYEPPRRRWYNSSGAEMEGNANMHSFQEFHQERRGRIIDNFVGHETEYKEQRVQIFPCSHDHFLEWCQRGFNEYGWTFGGIGAADASEHLADMTYGHHLRIKASAVLPAGADADAGQVIRWAEDAKERSDKTRPHFRAYAVATLRVLGTLYAPSNESFFRGNDLVTKLKLLLVENLYQLKRMV